MSAFTVSAFADDNAQSGNGDTQGATTGYAWYYSYQYLWKVTLFVGKSDKVSKTSNLQNDFHRIGTVVMKKTGWNIQETTHFLNKQCGLLYQIRTPRRFHLWIL